MYLLRWYPIKLRVILCSCQCALSKIFLLQVWCLKAFWNMFQFFGRWRFWLISGVFFLFEESVWIPRVCICRCDVWCWNVKIFWNMLHFQMVFGRGRCWLISGFFYLRIRSESQGTVCYLLSLGGVDTVDEKVFLHVRLLYAAYVGLDWTRCQFFMI